MLTHLVFFNKKQVGTGNVSVANEVAEVQRVLKASGLKYTMHSAGTTVEGSWDEVMKVVGQAHAVVHQGGVKRVQTSMRVGTRYVIVVVVVSCSSLLLLFCLLIIIYNLHMRALLALADPSTLPCSLSTPTEPTRNKQLRTRSREWKESCLRISHPPSYFFTFTNRALIRYLVLGSLLVRLCM